MSLPFNVIQFRMTLSFDSAALAAQPVLSKVEGLSTNGKNFSACSPPFTLSAPWACRRGSRARASMPALWNDAGWIRLFSPVTAMGWS